MSTHLHLLTQATPVALRTMELQRRGGVEIRCLLLHDAVTLDPASLPADSVASSAADCTLRGLTPPPSALDAQGIVAAIAAADMATSW